MRFTHDGIREAMPMHHHPPTPDAEWWDNQATPGGVFGVPGVDYDYLTERQARYIWAQLDPVHPTPYIADIGCGIGRLMEIIDRFHGGLHWYGVDVSPVMRRTAREAVSDAVVMNPETWGPLAVTFDGAYSVLVMQHIPDEAAIGYLLSIARKLRIGGRIVTQWLIGPDTYPRARNYPRDIDTVTRWHELVGLEVSSVIADAHVTGYSDEWVWITGERYEL